MLKIISTFIVMELEGQGITLLIGKLLDKIKGRVKKIASTFIIATLDGSPLTKWPLRNRFDEAREKASKAVFETDECLALRIKKFQFRDIRPKAASETDLAHASKLLGHTDKQIIKTVHQRVGEIVLPTK